MLDVWLMWMEQVGCLKETLKLATRSRSQRRVCRGSLTLEAFNCFVRKKAGDCECGRRLPQENLHGSTNNKRTERTDGMKEKVVAREEAAATG